MLFSQTCRYFCKNQAFVVPFKLLRPASIVFSEDNKPKRSSTLLRFFTTLRLFKLF